MALRSYLVGEVTQDFADGLLTRREALRRLVLLGVRLNSATALHAACGDGGERAGQAGRTAASPTSEATGDTPAPGATGSPTPGEGVTFAGPSGDLQGAWAAAFPTAGSGPRDP